MDEFIIALWAISLADGLKIIAVFFAAIGLFLNAWQELVLKGPGLNYLLRWLNSSEPPVKNEIKITFEV